jgi:hypothetical protein
MINKHNDYWSKKIRIPVKKMPLSCLAISISAGFLNTAYANEATRQEVSRTVNEAANQLVPQPVSDISPSIDENVERFEADRFMKFQPQTLYDILENIPGANNVLSAMSRTANNRGFGSDGDQILINNKRISGKENSIQNELLNIQAQDVDYIELIRGTRSDLDVQSNGLVINVLLKKQIESSILWTLGSVKTSDMRAKAIGSVFYSAGLDDVKYRIGLRHRVNPTELSTIEHFSSPEEELTKSSTWLRSNMFKEDQFSGKLEYQYTDKTALQLNGIYEKSYVDSVTTHAIDNWQAATKENRALMYDWDRDKWEVSGDLTHEFDIDNHVKLMFISNQFDADHQSWQVSFTNDQSSTPIYQLPRIYTTTEKVLRGNWRQSVNERHSFDSGIELAINSHDENVQFIKQSGNNSHSTEINDIKETRYEAFSHYNVAVSSNINLQSSLVYERSTIEVLTHLTRINDNNNVKNNGNPNDSGSQAQSHTSRTFNYLKPRLNIRYDINTLYQMRFNYQRNVSQLDLDDFVPVFNSYEALLEETNPELKPEVRDELSLSFEKKWLKSNGSITVSPYYHRINDLLTSVPLAVKSGNGNVDSGTEYGVKLETSFSLEALMLDNALISANYTWRDSEMINPFTEQTTAIERLSEDEWNIKLNHNEILPGLSYSVTLKKVSPYPFSQFDYQGARYSSTTGNAIVDYQINQHVKLSLKGDNLLKRKSSFERTRHKGTFTQTDVLRHEQRIYERAPRFTLSLSGKF